MAKGPITRAVQFEEIEAHHTTYINDGTLDADCLGMAVVLVANKTVGLGWDGGRVKGILKRVEPDLKVVVQDEGYKEDVPYSSAPAVGDRIISNGAGSVKPVASSGTIGDHEVVSVDTVKGKCILKLHG